MTKPKIDKDALAGDREKYKPGSGDGSEFFKVEPGEHIVFLCPPARGADLPYYTTGIHYTGEAGIVCADPDRNPLLKDPIFLRALKDAGKGIPEKCPPCANKKPGVKFFMVILPLMAKLEGSDEFKKYKKIECQPYIAPRQVWNGFAEALADVGGSVCDVDGPVLMKIKREGKKKTDTNYYVSVHIDSLKNPKALSDKLKKVVAAGIMEDGPADPYKILVNMFKSGDELEAAGSGMKVDEDSGKTDDLFGDDDEKTEEKEKVKEKPAAEPKSEEEPVKKPKKKQKRPSCYGIDYNAEDDACKVCRITGECKAEMGGETEKSEPSEDDEPAAKSDDGGDELDDLLDS